MSQHSGEGKALGDDAYRLFFESNPRPMWVFDGDTLSFLAVNDAACALYGWSRAELLAMTLRDIRSTDELPRFERYHEQQRATGESRTTTRGWHHVTKSGRHLVVDLELTTVTWQGRHATLVGITEVTEDSLAERRFRLLVENSADAFSIVDEKGIVQYVSPAVERILGIRPEALVGARASFVTHPDDVKRWIAPAPGETSVNVMRQRHQDGTWRCIEATTTNLLDEPSVRAFVSTFRDVSEREAAERAILDTRQRLEYVLSATAAVTYTARAGAGFGATFVSSNVEGVIGHPATSFVGDPAFWLDHIHPDDLPLVKAGLATLLETGEHLFQYRFRHADGRYRWMQDASRLVRDEDGQPKEIVGYWIDVTDRGQAEQALRRSEANFRILIERSPTATFVHRHGRIVYVNSATVAMLGYDDPAELIGGEMLELIHVDDRAFIRERIARTAREGGAGLAAARMLRRDGRVLNVEAEGVLLDFDGEASNVVLARDTTERSEMFARIAVADRMLSVGTLAAGVAHEINNPLAYVVSNLAVLSRELPALLSGNASSAERLSAVDLEAVLHDATEGAARVRGIVRDLRALSRADDETRGPVDVVDILRSSLKMAQNEIRHRARVVQELDEGLPMVHANPSRLGQVFLNLLVNAAQAIPDGHADSHVISVRARASSDSHRVVLEIEDTGAGIPPSVIGRIFDPFFTTKPIGVGTGLGLAICHQIVKSMDGEISVRSTPASGTCFQLTFPAASATDAHATPSLIADDARPWTTRVLMVDDEAALGSSTRLLLAPEHEVVPVTRARDALARLERGDRFDVILCDLMMPEMSGIEFHRQLERTAPEYVGRVLFITGGAFTKEARDFLAAVGSPHLEKPFSETELRNAIDAIRAPANGAVGAERA